MYGKFGNYFNDKNKKFHNSVWIELIGFEKNAADFGVSEYLDTLGFIPDSVSLHLTSVDFVNLHKGMDTEYILPPYVCSYGGHPQNDQRFRQDWTNYDLKKLIRTLQSRGIKVFASFFDLEPETEFSALHPELLSSRPCDDGMGSLIMIKRFADGTYYEDFLLKKLREVISDYGFDGIQLADGISSPRDAVWFADFSEDLIEQSKIKIPDGVTDAEAYIQRYRRKEWISFYRRRWGEFLTKIIKGIKETGALAAVNSAWTRDPFEAIYRYGADYKIIEEAGADYFVVEDVCSDLAILGYEDNHEYALSYEERKMIHYEFVANLMAISAHNERMKITPLFMIWDNQEQWSVIHHTPTAMQRAAAANFTHFCLKNDGWKPVTDGPHFCLGDALASGDWDFIRHCIDNGYTPEMKAADGAVFIWSARRMENELDSFINHGTYHSAKWLAVLLRAGAAVSRAADISRLGELNGDILVTNYSLLPEDERAAVDAYTGGRVIKADYRTDADTAHTLNPDTAGWVRPLNFADMPEEYIKGIVAEINETANAAFISGGAECTLNEIITGRNTSVMVIENNEYYYVLPRIKTKRRIKSIKIITKPDGYPLVWSENEFRVRVAGRGADIAELEYFN